MSEFWKRTLSGAVYVGVVVSSIVFIPELFGLLSCVLAWLSVREFNRLHHPRCLVDIESEIGAALLVASIAHVSYMPENSSFISDALPYIVLMLALIICELWDQKNNPVDYWGRLFTGQVMLALPFALMNVLNSKSNWLLLAVFVLIWVNDSGAYCVGSLTAKRKGGNHKMFSRVSPKKSWEGLFGGILLTIVVSALLAHFRWFDGIGGTLNAYIKGILFASVVSIFGTLGDLMESLFKRSIGVKDSGKFLPGHGGVLDRFDSILLAAPVALLLVMVISHC